MKEYNENETTEERHANSVNLLDTIKEHVRHEREIMEAGRVAFVADIRVSFFFHLLQIWILLSLDPSLTRIISIFL